MSHFVAHKHHAKKWGYETHLVNQTPPCPPVLGNGMETGYCLKELTVIPNGQACSIHFHRLKHETFYMVDGFLMLEIWSQIKDAWVAVALGDPPAVLKHLKHRAVMKLDVGETFTIAPFRPHRFWAPRVVAKFIEVSTPDRAEDSYRIVEAGDKPKDRALPAHLRRL